MNIPYPAYIALPVGLSLIAGMVLTNPDTLPWPPQPSTLNPKTGCFTQPGLRHRPLIVTALPCLTAEENAAFARGEPSPEALAKYKASTDDYQQRHQRYLKQKEDYDWQVAHPRDLAVSRLQALQAWLTRRF